MPDYSEEECREIVDGIVRLAKGSSLEICGHTVIEPWYYLSGPKWGELGPDLLSAIRSAVKGGE